MSTLPTGVVTFLFSDLEGSTRLLEAHGAATGQALQRHHELFEDLIAANEGVIFETVGDAVYAAFASPPNALAAALDAHRALQADPWEEIGGRLACRIAIHSGSVETRGTHYFGPPLFRCARLQALAHGEQTVLSQATASLVNGNLPPGATLLDRGIHRLKDLHEPEHVFELQHPDLRTDFPPLRSLDAGPHNLPTQLSSFVGREEELATSAASSARPGWSRCPARAASARPGSPSRRRPTRSTTSRTAPASSTSPACARRTGYPRRSHRSSGCRKRRRPPPRSGSLAYLRTHRCCWSWTTSSSSCRTQPLS